MTHFDFNIMTADEVEAAGLTDAFVWGQHAYKGQPATWIIANDALFGLALAALEDSAWLSVAKNAMRDDAAIAQWYTTWMTGNTQPNITAVGTPFQQQVWQQLLTIPVGSTIDYQTLAADLARPESARAVANAVGANPIADWIPCHRVIRKTGELGGYRWGLEQKQQLLAAECVAAA